jgi:exopolysaccharide/PEP-CTERM locus tyrosine autokinase
MSKIEDALEKAYKLRDTAEEFRVKNTNDSKSVKVSLNITNSNIVTLTEPDSPFSEEYRRLKSMLIRETKSDFLNTMMVTSAVEGEGKTLTSINIAVTMAQEIDHNILLIDADLRKPMICEYLGIEYKYGLSDYLREDIDLSDVLVKTGIGKLVVLPAGKNPDNPVELISSEKMKMLVKEIKQRYVDRYIIIDTPPILAFAEGISLASLVDGIIFVIKNGHAQKKAIDNALSILKDLKILGVVFNSVSSANEEGYANRYGYYYAHKKRDKK